MSQNGNQKAQKKLNLNEGTLEQLEGTLDRESLSKVGGGRSAPPVTFEKDKKFPTPLKRPGWHR